MDEVNHQIVEAVVLTNEIVLANAAPVSQGVVLQAQALSLSLLMQNAVTHQFAGAQIADAAVASACAAIIEAGAKTPVAKKPKR